MFENNSSHKILLIAICAGFSFTTLMFGVGQWVDDGLKDDVRDVEDKVDKVEDKVDTVAEDVSYIRGVLESWEEYPPQ